MINHSEAMTAGLALSPGRNLFGVVPLYSLLIAMGILLALMVASSEEKRMGLPKDTMVDAALWMVPAGIVGARLYYVIFSWDQFAHEPWRILYIWEGGVAIYGAVLGGVFALAGFAKRRKMHLLTLMDAVIPGLLLAQAIGRWGNYFNMEAYGAAITNPSLQFFPMAVLIPEAAGYAWHAATFFYEFVWNLAGFLTLLMIRKKVCHRGDVTMGYMLIYGTGRMIIEGLRTDSLMAAHDTLRVSQIFSLLLATAVIIILLWRLSREWQLRSWVMASIGAVVSLLISLIFPPPMEAFLHFRLSVAILSAIAMGGMAGLAVGSANRGLPVFVAWGCLLLTVLVQGLYRFLHHPDAIVQPLLQSSFFAGWLLITGAGCFVSSNTNRKEAPCQ